MLRDAFAVTAAFLFVSGAAEARGSMSTSGMGARLMPSMNASRSTFATTPFESQPFSVDHSQFPVEPRQYLVHTYEELDGHHSTFLLNGINGALLHSRLSGRIRASTRTSDKETARCIYFDSCSPRACWRCWRAVRKTKRWLTRTLCLPTESAVHSNLLVNNAGGNVQSLPDVAVGGEVRVFIEKIALASQAFGNSLMVRLPIGVEPRDCR